MILRQLWRKSISVIIDVCVADERSGAISEPPATEHACSSLYVWPSLILIGWFPHLKFNMIWNLFTCCDFHADEEGPWYLQCEVIQILDFHPDEGVFWEWVEINIWNPHACLRTPGYFLYKILLPLREMRVTEASVTHSPHWPVMIYSPINSLANGLTYPPTTCYW